MKNQLMMMDKRLTKCHSMIIGHTGSGKTMYAFMRAWLAPPGNYNKYSKVKGIKEKRIMFDTQNNSFDDEYAALIRRYSKAYPDAVGVCHEVDTFIEMWDYDEGRVKFICFAPHSDEHVSVYREKVEEILRLIRKHQASQRSTEREDIYLYFDEISVLTDKQKESEVSYVYTRGRQMKMWACGISQQPRLVPRYCLDEAKYKIFYELTNEHWTVIQDTYRIKPSEETKEYLWNTPYSFVVYDGHEWSKGKIINF